MQKKYQRIYSKVVKTIRAHGIPDYVRKWKPCKFKDRYDTESDFIIDLNKCVKNYHWHTFIFYQGNYPRSKKQIRAVKKEKPRRYAREPRKFPKMTLDQNKIGMIQFYKYCNLPDPKKSYEYLLIFVKYVKDHLRKWQKLGLRGLVIDFRYHYGGSVIPIYYALSDIFEGSTLFAWSNKKAKHQDEVWVNMEGGNVKYNRKFIGKHLNISIPVAVIIGGNTSSAGEVGAAMFCGRDNVKFFGERTSGELSGNLDIKINQDIKLVITGSLITTVDGKFRKEQYLRPDKATSRPIGEAKKWINQLS